MPGTNRSSLLLLVFCILFCSFIPAPAFSQPDFSAEKAASENAMNAIGATKFRVYYGNDDEGLMPYASFSSQSTYFNVTRCDQQNLLTQSFQNLEKENPDSPWKRGSFNGYPTMEIHGHTDSHKYGGKGELKVDIARVDATIYVLFPRYLVSVKATETKVKDLSTNYKTALNLLETWYSGMLRAGLLPGGSQQEEGKGSLVITVIGSENLMVSNAICRIKTPAGDSKELVTDKNGRSKCEIVIPDVKSGGIVTIEEIVLTPKSFYGHIFSHLKRDLAVKIDKKVTLNEKNKYVGEFPYNLELRPVFVKAAWGDALEGRGSPRPSTTVARGSDAAFVGFLGDQFSDEDRARILFPAKELTGINKAVFFAKTSGKERYIAEETIDMPGIADTSKAVILELLPDTITAQFNLMRPKLEKFLSDSGFSNEEIKKIVNVKFRECKRTGQRYWANESTIEISSSDTLRKSSIPIFHELAHHIVEIIGHDDPDGVGGTHEVHTPTNPAHAWDEGRAHFFARTFTEEMGLPSEPLPQVEPSAHTDHANRQLSVYRALGDYYVETGCFKPAEAIKSLRENNARAIKELGRPPRTIMEFVNIERSLAANDKERLKALQLISQKYGF